MAELKGKFILLGSGETSPSMVTFHQKTLASAARAAFLDSSYGFQANADDLTEKIGRYFADSVGRKLNPIRLRSVNSPSIEVATARKQLRESDFVIAGPGSPTYALDVWRAHNFADEFLNLLASGTLVMSSAAALSMGAFAIPVYEIYKVGQTPSWREGLNVLQDVTGISAAVVPHFNNAEGGRHDTSCCYIGKQRLELLEQELPSGTLVIGIDEHTGILFDLANQSVEVFGAGGLTVRTGDQETFHPTGTRILVSDLPSSSTTPKQIRKPEAKPPTAIELLNAGEIDASIVAAVEDLDIDRLHQFVLGLADVLKASVADQNSAAPFIEALIELRNKARAAGRFDDADFVRNLLAAQSIEISDSAAGSTWKFRT